MSEPEYKDLLADEAAADRARLIEDTLPLTPLEIMEAMLSWQNRSGN